MCKKFVLASSIETIENRYNARLDQNTIEIQKSYSVSCGDYSYVITCENPHVVQVFKFGMTPFYSAEPLNITNARAEGAKNRNDDASYKGSKSIFLQTAFKKPIQSQRCIVIADAWYEWSDLNKPYLVYLQNKNRPFGFASIYDLWVNPETKEIVTSFAIITTTANSLLQSIGFKRMPVILSKSNETAWINASNPLSESLRLLMPYPSEKMNAYPVSNMVNIKGLNDLSMLKPIGEKLLVEAIPVNATGGYHHKNKPHSDEPWFQSKL